MNAAWARWTFLLENEMKTLFRRLRGLLGTATAWGLSWFVGATAFFAMRSLGVVPFRMVLSSALGVGAAGFLA